MIDNIASIGLLEKYLEVVELNLARAVIYLKIQKEDNQSMNLDVWHPERLLEEALKIPKGSYTLNNLEYIPEGTDVTKAAEVLKKANFDEIFYVQSQIMAKAHQEGLAFQDWPEIKFLPFG